MRVMLEARGEESCSPMFCTAALIMWIPYQPSVLAPLDLHAGELDLDGFGEPPPVDLVVAHEGGRFEWLLSFEP